ncbi:uncharacterized protein LAESUDRAFT_675278 [Laetiporus sulphureus 93-53]|uniref:FCH-domain-containing protein n=1 Tax=Laetiporus sulphureus 93-53 TaxID=1314785 RepID=A0A165FSM1_9APHY|nr:uncharacterized protein LAESUDRAFT_675278 [Laetiporus sulphureus 93-53]KZT09361.1 hypothetical protein LAESUDRAFT_675278 [Laetiporus sulphureus 93-53]
MEGGQTYGKELADQVDRLVSLSDAQLELLADVRELYKERVVLEREYAGKLQALAKKAADKKSKKEAILVVGNEPTKSWGEDTLQLSTLNNAYGQIISAMLESAQAHVSLSDQLTSQVIDALKGSERRHEEAKKKQEQHFAKLLAERDRVYSERVKSKQKYDDECNEVETYRQKQERANDDRHADRAAKQYEQQQVDMLNGKNVYLVSIAAANAAKAKFYNEDLPALENQFQLLHTQLLTRFATINLQAQALQKSHLETLKDQLSTTEEKLKAMKPQADQNLFIEHNLRTFMVPTDWSFEPCSTHYDTGDMSVEPAPKVYLQNRLTKSRAKLSELRPVIDGKRRDVEQFSKLMDAYTKNSSLGNADEASDSYLEAQHQLTFFTCSECVLSAEVETISTALGGDEGEQRPHTFKSSTFSIPTTCAYCKSNIWGLSKQGKTCKACGISVHSKCELKVPAECSGSRGSSRTNFAAGTGSTMSRSSTISSQASTPSLRTPTPSSFISQVSATEEAGPRARVLFNFSPTSPFELGVSVGATVQVLEEDDGSGWVKVADGSGGKGLVPATYVEMIGASVPIPVPPSSTRPSLQNSGQYVKGMYPYQSQGPDELSVQEGGLIELTSGPTGGTRYADGWWEGVDATGRKGIFPSNYVELVQ